MNLKDAISIIVQTLIFILSSVFLLVGTIREDPNIGKLIFCAWLALTTQQNFFHRIS